MSKKNSNMDYLKRLNLNWELMKSKEKSNIDYLKRLDLDLKVLKSLVSELREGENEYNSDIILEVSKKILNREICPFDAIELIQTKTKERMELKKI